jgi:putative hydrolase of the HAD superfamily
VAGKIKAVIFDLGNVLIDLDPRVSAEKLSGCANKSVGDIYGIFSRPQLIRPFEEGSIPPEEFFVQVKAALCLEMGFEQFKDIWNGVFFFKPDNRRVYELIRRLYPNYIVALLSNTNQLHFEYLRSEFPVFDHFHQILLSYELGLVKPDPMIYRKTLSILRVDPTEAFYADDRPEMIEAAGRIGIRAFVFKGYSQLLQDLADCGVNSGR